jgi:hypothetical protein
MSFGEITRYYADELEDPNQELAREDVGFTGPDIETAQAAISEQIFQRLAERAPGWQAHDGNPDVWVIEAFSEVAAELRALITTVTQAIFITYGSEVLGRPIRPAAPATAPTRWIAEDDRGYDVAPGLQIVVAKTGDQLVGFEVISGGSILPGQTIIEGIEVVAVRNGADANGLLGAAELADPLDWVRSVELTAPSEGGDDGQDRDAYLDNLTNLLRIIAFRPVLPPDFALLALQVPGVGRAVAMDGYDPGAPPLPGPARAPSWGNVRTVTLVLTDPEGEPLPDPVKDRVRAELEDARELNFIVNTIDPTYEPIDVTYEVTTFAEQDEELVRETCDDALRQMLAPSQFRLGITSPAIAAGEVIPPPEQGQRAGRSVIRVNDLIGRLDRVRGVDFVGPGDLLVNGVHADYPLEGPTTLPRPGTINGTVNVPAMRPLG